MNELQQIRSMAEMILEKVTALEGAKPECKPVPKFRVGDRVRIEELVAKGEDAPVGTVVNVYLGSNTIYDISINDDPRFGFGHRRKMVWEKYLTKVVEPKFKVGDRVVYQSSGEQGTVIDASIGSMGIEYIVWQPDNKFAQPHMSTPAADLVKAPKFRVGDRVVGDFDRITKIGTITLQYGSGGEWYVVEWDDRTTNSVSIHDKHSDKFRLATKDDREWHSGPPPHVGWWNASMNESPNTWRWWNGTAWSTACFQGIEINEIGRIALEPGDTYEQECVQWSDYWPENARVPRIDPTKV
jgi:hypothetical protein